MVTVNITSVLYYITHFNKLFLLISGVFIKTLSKYEVTTVVI